MEPKAKTKSDYVGWLLGKYIYILLNCVFTLLYIKYIILFTCSHYFVVNILFYCSEYIILLYYLYYFIVLKVKIKPLILDVLGGGLGLRKQVSPP